MTAGNEKPTPSSAKVGSTSFIGGASTYLVSNILVAAIPFLLLPVLTRYLGPTEYGRVAMFQALIGGLGAIFGLSVAGAANRKFFDGGVDLEEIGQFIGACLQILTVTTGACLLVLYVFREALTSWLGVETSWLYLAALTYSATVVLQLRLGQWQVRRQAIAYGALQVSSAMLNVLLSLLLVVSLMLGASGRVLGQSASAIAIAAVALLLLRKDGLLGLRSWRPDYVMEALRFGVPLVPHIAGLYLLSFADRLVINQELGLEQAGIYVVAAQLAGGMGIVFDAVNKAYVPWLYDKLAHNDAREKRTIVRNTYAWFAAILLAVGVAFLAGPWLVVVVAGPAYVQASEVIGWLVLGAGFNGMYLMVTNYIFYSKKTGLLSVVTLFSAAMNIGLLIALTRMLGLKGAAMAFSLAAGLRFAMTWWVAHRRHPMPWFRFG